MASEEARVKVAVSVRKLSEKERGDGEERVVWTQGKEIRVLNPESRKEKVFKFDYTVSLIHYSKHENDSKQAYFEFSNQLVFDRLLSSACSLFRFCSESLPLNEKNLHSSH